jgi:hypothetical protein
MANIHSRVVERKGRSGWSEYGEHLGDIPGLSWYKTAGESTFSCQWKS